MKTVVMPLRRKPPGDSPSAPPPAPEAPAPPPSPPNVTAPLRVPFRPTIHPLAEPMYWAAVDLLTFAAQFALGGSPGSVADLRPLLAQHFAAMETRARAAGIPPEDIRDAAYPIMALFDEILVQIPWSGQEAWRAEPLQLVHFQENSAGETFFQRVELLLQQPHRAHVLQVYFFCLALGFQGRYAMGGSSALGSIYDTVAAALGHVVPPNEVISPHAVAADTGRSLLTPDEPIVRLGLAVLALAALVFLVLRLTLSSTLSKAEQPMDDFARAGAGRP